MTTIASPLSVFATEAYNILTQQQSGASSSSMEYHGVHQAVPFPWKLHEMLEEADSNNFTNIVSWLPDHSSFRVHQPEIFVNQIMPKYFRQTKYKSFQRQLNMWGFERLISGPNKGGYSHESFVRGQPALCHRMKRLKIKGTGTCSKPASSPSFSPNKFQNSSVIPRAVPSLDKTLDEQTLFDEDTLMSVLSSAIDSTTTPAPQEGDCVLFEGMKFFFVDDYNNAGKSSNQSKPSRRLSLEFQGSAVSGNGRRRMSLVGAMTYSSSQFNRRLSIELSSHNNGVKSQDQQVAPVQRRRASRRFSLERGAANGAFNSTNFVLREMKDFAEI